MELSAIRASCFGNCHRKMIVKELVGIVYVIINYLRVFTVRVLYLILLDTCNLSHICRLTNSLRLMP